MQEIEILLISQHFISSQVQIFQLSVALSLCFRDAVWSSARFSLLPQASTVSAVALETYQSQIWYLLIGVLSIIAIWGDIVSEPALL